MSQRAVQIILIALLVALVGCGKTTEEVVTEPSQHESNSYFYDNPERGIRIQSADGWVIEEETATSVKFKSEKLVGIISVIPKEKSVAEIKKELRAAAGNVAVIGEGLNFISWKTERQENIVTNVWVDEKSGRHIIITILTPEEIYKDNKEKIEIFRENIEVY